MASPTELARRLRDEYGQKARRYIAVSAFNVIFGQALLVLAREGFGWSFAWSNVFGVCVSAFPAYVLSRRWIWQKSGDNHFFKEVVPFWSMGLAGLALSTVFAWQAEQYSDATWVLQVTNLSAFGILWVAKFVILDKILFVSRDEPLTDDALDAFVDEVLLHREAAAEASPPVGQAEPGTSVGQAESGTSAGQAEPANPDER